MTNAYIPKNLIFPVFPLIFVFIEYDYVNATTIEELVALFYKWEKIAEETNNPVKKGAYVSASLGLFSELTNISYTTKKFKQI